MPFCYLQISVSNLRHYAFLNQGLADIEEDRAARNITFIVRQIAGLA